RGAHVLLQPLPARGSSEPASGCARPLKTDTSVCRLDSARPWRERNHQLMEDIRMARVPAVFDDQTQAERAIDELRRHGITDAEMSIVSRRPDDVEVTKAPAGDKTAERVGKGATAGGGVGALFCL